MNELKEKLKSFRALAPALLVLLLGILLMTIPSGQEKRQTAGDESQLLAQLLSECSGIGDARVLISDKGVIVACEGAAKASVRLDILRAVSSYTGFGSEKITILQLYHGA